MASRALDYFNLNLPEKPYCTDDFLRGLQILPQAQAMLKRYIQPNPPHSTYCFVFDIDRAGAAIDWADRNCPAPNLTLMNLLNARAHVAYLFETGIRTAPDANLAPLKYAAAVERGLCTKLGGDFGYAGLVCKNPNHADWRVTQWQPNLYTLDWLADYLDLSASNGSQYDYDYGLGRNCTLFEKTRKWAYRAIRRGWPDYRQWFAACFERAMGYNIQFPVPLSEPEVHHLAKSVAKWTHRHFTEKSFAEYVARTHTPKIQAARGRKTNNWSEAGALGGKISHGGGRPTVGTHDVIDAIQEFKSKGYSHREIAKILNVSPSTVSILSRR